MFVSQTFFLTLTWSKNNTLYIITQEIVIFIIKVSWNNTYPYYARHTLIFLLFILFYILISWSISLNSFHNILVTDHHSTIFKNTTMYKTCLCHFAIRLQRNFKNLYRPACQNQMPASLVIHQICIPPSDREIRKRDLCAQVNHPADGPYSRIH